MKFLTPVLRRLSAFVFALSLAAAPSAQAAEQVNISELTWGGARAIAYVIKAVVELRLGGKAEIIQADNAVTWAALGKGDGSIDVNPDMWMPNHQANWDKYIETGKVDHNAKPYPAKQRIVLPTYAAKEFGISSVDDLKNADVAAKFDTDGNGLGEIYTGQAGWASTKTWNVKIKSYGLDEWWEGVEYDHGIFKSKFDGDYKKKKPAMFYLWAPEPMNVKYDLTDLQEPARTEGCEKLVDFKRDDWLEASHSRCASNAPEVWVAFTKTLHERAPKTAKFLKQIEIDPDMVSELVLREKENKEDIQDLAEEWVEKNSAAVDRWVAGI